MDRATVAFVRGHIPLSEQTVAAPKLVKYQEMRDFAQTAEPSGKAAMVVPSEALRFVIQKHARKPPPFRPKARAGGDFPLLGRSEGPIARPKGPPHGDWRVEDHPLDYGDFEGTIPKGQYGGGTVMLWDRGYWAPEKGFEKIDQALAKGELSSSWKASVCMAPGCWCAPNAIAEARRVGC